MALEAIVGGAEVDALTVVRVAVLSGTRILGGGCAKDRLGSQLVDAVIVIGSIGGRQGVAPAALLGVVQGHRVSLLTEVGRVRVVHELDALALVGIRVCYRAGLACVDRI